MYCQVPWIIYIIFNCIFRAADLYWCMYNTVNISIEPFFLLFWIYWLFSPSSRAYRKLSCSSEAYFTLRSNFGTTHALISVCQYLLGIGDRHPSNFMIDLVTGCMVGIDFGHAFGSATTVRALHITAHVLLSYSATFSLTKWHAYHVKSPECCSIDKSKMDLYECNKKWTTRLSILVGITMVDGVVSDEPQSLVLTHLKSLHPPTYMFLHIHTDMFKKIKYYLS